MTAERDALQVRVVLWRALIPQTSWATSSRSDHLDWLPVWSHAGTWQLISTGVFFTTTFTLLLIAWACCSPVLLRRLCWKSVQWCKLIKVKQAFFIITAFAIIETQAVDVSAFVPVPLTKFQYWPRQMFYMNLDCSLSVFSTQAINASVSSSVPSWVRLCAAQN